MKQFTHINLELPYKDLEVTDTDSGRFYITPEGNRYPSVTSFLGWKDRAYWEEWRKNNPTAGDKAADRGTDLHLAIEKFLKNEENPDSHLKPNTTMMFKLFKKKLVNIDNIRVQEYPLYSDYFKLAGRTDCVAEYNGKLSVIDFKTSKRIKQEKWIQDYFLQSSIYAYMWKERFKENVSNAVIIIGTDELACQVFEIKPINHIAEILKRLKEYRSEQK